MPLPLLAAVAGQASTLFNYNRANFLYDKGQQVQRVFTGLNYQLQQFQLYRQDIRDLVGLTTEKMANYHVVACLELGMCATLLGPARLPKEVPEWVLWHQLVSLCAAVAFLVTSMWLATRAAVAAGSFNVRLQTQYIRLPLPNDDMLDTALTRAEEFEGQDLESMLRMPFLRGVWNDMWNGSPDGSTEEAMEGGAPPQQQGSCQGSVQHHSSGFSEKGAAPKNPLQSREPGLDQTACGLALYQRLQRRWSCYDAYARVTMSIGTYWLILSIAYYEIGWTQCVQSRSLPAVTVAIMLSGVVLLLVYLDLFVSKKEVILAAVLIFSGPLLVAWGAALKQLQTPWHAIATGAVHTCLTLWFWHVGSIVPGKADLPTRFKGVVYLDIFGPIMDEIRTHLVETGLGKHAAVMEEGEDFKVASASLQKVTSRRGSISQRDVYLDVERTESRRKEARDWLQADSNGSINAACRNGSGSGTTTGCFSMTSDDIEEERPRSREPIRDRRYQVPEQRRSQAAYEQQLREKAALYGKASPGAHSAPSPPAKKLQASPPSRNAAHGNQLPTLLPRQNSRNSNLSASTDIDEDDCDPGNKNGSHRHGHHPVLAYRIMSIAMACIWLTGAGTHTYRLVNEREIIPSLERRLSGVEEGSWEHNGWARPMATPLATSTGGVEVSKVEWPERFFRPSSLVCPGAAGEEPSGLVASNGFLVYAHTAGKSVQALTCPVESHNALVSANCSGTGAECKAVVASGGSLWQCGSDSEGMNTEPVATFSAASPWAKEALPLWTSADPQHSVLFAAPRKGPIMELHRVGTELHPVAELPLPSGAPETMKWLSLAIVHSNVLVAVADPGPTMLAWSLRSGKLLGALALSAHHAEWDWAGWCVGAEGDLYGALHAKDDLEDGNIAQLLHLALPNIERTPLGKQEPFGKQQL
mmetsp:Transcript_92081/g.237604  ORF Transcript_92081/g.237604 Transcript_92081/m.237604 type:complete len:925 (-) Transcript_92081:288-3062(-)